jgi:hypothetical protein
MTVPWGRLDQQAVAAGVVVAEIHDAGNVSRQYLKLAGEELQWPQEEAAHE